MRLPAWVHEAFCESAPMLSLVLAVLSMPLLPAMYWWCQARGPVGRLVERGA